jgi:hypothetical protein
MYRTIQQSLQARIQAILFAKYDITLTNLVVEQPPSTALGELALPVAFELAKRLRKAPRAIAAELAAELTAALPDLEGITSVEVAGAGYLNIRIDRAATVRRIAADQHANIGGPGFRLVEHPSINPNKAAHIGHLLMAPTRVSDSREVLFVVDTGSDRTLISYDMAAEVSKVNRDDGMRMQGLSGQVADLYKTGSVFLQFAGYRQKSPGMTSVDMWPQSRMIGTEVSGFFGLPVLSLFTLTIDYRDGVVTFDRTGQ